VLTVAIIGAGALGRSLALRAARAGFRVLLEDLLPANLNSARDSIHKLLGPEKLSALVFVPAIEDAVREADLVIDCVPDELESKLEILWLIDRMAPPRTVIATPTLNLSITDLASCTYRPGKCIAIAASPATLQSAVSSAVLLRITPATSQESVALASHFFLRLGFYPAIEPEQAIPIPPRL